MCNNCGMSRDVEPEKCVESEGDNIQKEKDRRDIEMMKACMRCSVPWSECCACEGCPYLKDLLEHPDDVPDPID